jgi:hypothetical protein
MVLPSTWKNVFQLGKMHFCFFNFGNFGPHDFGGRFDPYSRTHYHNRYLPPPPLRTSTAPFSQHGISSLTAPCFAAFNRSPEGWDKNSGVDQCAGGGFSKAPHSCGGVYCSNILPSMLSFPRPLTPPTPMWEASCNKIRRPSASPWFFLQKVDRDRISLFLPTPPLYPLQYGEYVPSVRSSTH